MVSCLLYIAGAVLLGSSLAQAQTAREGHEAFARGDYARAAEILKPIAESWPSRDPVAEFFMATLYEKGLGVTADPVRACALYLRVSIDRSGPFARPAEELHRRLQGSLTFAEFQRCARLVNVGFNHGFEPATFVFEPGHWIRIELDGATMMYDGKEKPIDVVFGTTGAIFMPVEHTELTVGSSHSARRHFLEFFTWLPREPGRTWMLFWRVLEVVRDNVVPVTSAELATVSGERPPDRLSFDARAIARLRVSDTGYAEWVISSGPKQGSGFIETEAERQETQAQSRARQAALARVDWNRARDLQQPPALRFSDADGCGDASVYGWSDDRTEVITIRADKDVLGLSTAPRTFDLATPPPGLEVQVLVYQRPVRSWPFCTDVHMDAGPVETWKAIGGSVTIELTPPVVRAHLPKAYRVTIRIIGLEVVNTKGVRARQLQPLTFIAIVGRMWG